MNVCVFLNALTPDKQNKFIRLHLEKYAPTYALGPDGAYSAVSFGTYVDRENLNDEMRVFNPVVYALCGPIFTGAGLGRLADDLEKPMKADIPPAPRVGRPTVTINISGPVGVGKTAIASGLAYMLHKREFNVDLRSVDDAAFEPPVSAWDIEEKPVIVFTETVEQPRRVGMPPALGAPYGNAPDPREFATDFVGDLATAVMDAPIGLGKPGHAAAESWDPRAITAPGLLQRAAQHMQDRAAQRDQPEGERSMRRTVDAFNALLGTTLSERDGWLFMGVLKIARATNTPTGDLDDYEDLAAYAALAGESVAKGEQA